MLESHSKRICTFFAVDYHPQIGYATKLSEAVQSIQGKLNAPHWGFGQAAYVLRNPEQRFLLTMDFRRIGCQTLYLDTWEKGLDDYGSLVRMALDKIGIKTVKRLGFKTVAFLPLGMSHAEMCDLVFGSFLLPASDLQDIANDPEDALVQIHGSYKNMKTVLVVAPMTVEQAARQFMATPNLEHFIEPKLLDTGAKEFRDRLDSDCFFVDVDMFRTDAQVSDLPFFLKDSLQGALHLSEQAVRRLRGLRPNRD